VPKEGCRTFDRLDQRGDKAASFVQVERYMRIRGYIGELPPKDDRFLRCEELGAE
jgi:hypothetical protein